MPTDPDFLRDLDLLQSRQDKNKPTVLIVSDSGAVHSGFAQVVRNIWKRLWVGREWNILQFGWWHADPMEKVPWSIISTNRDPNNERFVDMADKYGERSIEKVVGRLRPDLVWVMGDPWMVVPTLKNPSASSYVSVLYVPVDGAPLVYGWDVLREASIVVPYLPWGERMIKRWCPEVKLAEPIPHGVDTELYTPLSPERRKEVREGSLKVGDDDVVVLSVSRNQGRKNLPAMIEISYYIRSGDYRTCKACGKAWRNPYDYHSGKPSGNKAVCKDCLDEDEMEDGVPNPHFYYYIHTPISDLVGHSWNLTSIMNVFGLGVPEGGDIRYPGFRWNDRVLPIHGIQESQLRDLYGACDIFALPTVGEGFGLPILEAMSCGTPAVVPNVSSHPDFVSEGGGLLVDIGYHVCEPLSVYYRGYPDLDDYLTKILLLVRDKDLRATLGRAARATAMKYDWNVIAEKWRKLINSQLVRASGSRRWQQVVSV